MPVQKFRSVEEMPPIPRCKSLDEECLRRIAALWAGHAGEYRPAAQRA
jgi:hypothetical protein